MILAPDMTLLEAMEGLLLAGDPCICEPWLGYRCPHLDNGLQGLAGQCKDGRSEPPPEYLPDSISLAPSALGGLE